MGETVTRRFKIEGMACTACEAAVERAAKRVAGVAWAKASLTEELLEAGYAEDADADAVDKALAAAIEAAGYEASALDIHPCPAQAGASGTAASARRIAADRMPGITGGAGASEKRGGSAGASPDAAAQASAGIKGGARQTGKGPAQEKPRAKAAHSGSTHGPTGAKMARSILSSLAIVCGLAILLFLARQLGLTDVFLAFPTVGTETMAYPALFGVGLLTSVHCIAMCGGLNLGESLIGDDGRLPGASRPGRLGSSLRSPALYNAGRLVSYSAIGALLGLVGSAFSVSPLTRAVVGVAAGIMMMVLGLSLTGAIPPGLVSNILPKSLVKRLGKASRALRSRGPFLLGVANGFMPCGPLQAMQLYAIATGDPARGALSLFAFCLGTVPLMFVAGGVISALKARWRRAIMRVGGAALVLFGLVAAGNGLALAGVATPWSGINIDTEAAAVATMGADGVQRATVKVDYGSYQDVHVKAGAPVELTFHVPEGELIGCNASLSIPAFGVTADLSEGDTTVAFTPTQPGTYPYSCWMGMIKATIVVEG